ncbi:MAG: response regulator [Candidatus Rokubacteria bacterium]|nr:response regulator [Candidatus Rokubacteria bacterium]
MASPRKRVLIVDDNEVIREILREFLSPAYHVDTAAHAAQALTVLIQRPPDVILLDVRMPGVDGLSLLRMLRQTGVATPVIIITGYNSTEVAEEARTNGADAYLPKPFDLRHLDRLIVDALAAPSSR